MKIGDVCTRDVVAVLSSDAVLDAARVMRDKHVGDVVVLDAKDRDRRPVGILTDRDIVVGIVAQAPDKIERLLVEDVMTGALTTVDMKDTLDTALEIMRERGVRRLPVVGSDGRLAGILTFDDVIRVMAQQFNDLATVVVRERQVEERTRV